MVDVRKVVFNHFLFTFVHTNPKKMRLSRYTFLFIALSVALVFNSCKKSKLNKETTSAEDNALAEDSFDDVFKNISEAAEDLNLDGTAKMGVVKDYTFGAHCATVTLDPPAWDSNSVWNSVFPKTLTIDFGTTNCVGYDNKARRGKIISVFSGKYNTPGTTITTSLDNYHVDDYHIEGVKSVTNNGNFSFSITVVGKITSPDGSDEVTWNSTRTRKWIEGQNTNFFTLDPLGNWMGLNGIYDDVYSITGTANGVNRNGRSYSAKITTPLRVEFCTVTPIISVLEITEGIIELEPYKLKVRSVDFGNRTCDRTFEVTIGNKTFTKTY